MLHNKSLLCLTLVVTSTYLTVVKAKEGEEAESHHRQKRFIYFNTNTPVDLGFIITLPLSFALPTFNLKTARRFRRQVHRDNYAYNMTANDVLPDGSYDEEAYAEELQKMTAYFSALENFIIKTHMICKGCRGYLSAEGFMRYFHGHRSLPPAQ